MNQGISGILRPSVNTQFRTANKNPNVTIPSAYQTYKVVENGVEVTKNMTLLQAILTTYDHSQALNL